MDVIGTYLLENAPVVLVAGFILGFLVWKFAAFYFTRFKKTEEKVENLPCDDHRSAIINIEHSLSGLLGKKGFKAQLTLSRSPRRLSDLGQELYQTSGMPTVLRDNMPHFIENNRKHQSTKRIGRRRPCQFNTA
jgi:hypothetical protein